jgi:hypothetical protein
MGGASDTRFQHMLLKRVTIYSCNPVCLRVYVLEISTAVKISIVIFWHHYIFVSGCTFSENFIPPLPVFLKTEATDFSGML